MYILKISNLCVKIKNQLILNKLNINIKKGEIHVIMGPNGSGKSTLSLTIAGHKKYKIHNGSILFNNKNISKYSIDERAKKGLFISFQKDIEIPGLNNQLFLYESLNSIRKYNNKKLLNIVEFKKKLKKKISILNYSSKLLKRSVNENFSGGERKKNDILHILLIKPKLIILDEIDSGLDIDTSKNIFNIINKLKKKKKSLIIITHNTKIVNFIKVDYLHILNKGKIIKTNNKNIINIIEKKGYNFCFEKN